ncbi:MAG: hypothetical protein ACRDJE_13170, partial [Dehalococcoidia bacterium]
MTTENQTNEEEQATPAEAAEAPQRPAPDFAWMRVPTQRGMKPTPGPEGLRLEHIDVGSYGDVPDVWPYKNDTPRGSHPSTNAGLLAGYSIFDKVDVWSDNVRVLYEDAIRDRWASATDIPWETLQPYPEHIEHAICQICTEMSEQAYVTIQIFSSWLEKISYGFHEVKNFLATQIFDNARHVEAFRKRALANGGGLGIESPGIFHRGPASAMKWTELVIITNLIRAPFNLVVVEALKSKAQSEAEKTLYGNIARDLRRHIDYGVGHVNYYLSRQPTMHEQVHTWLNRGEFLLVADQRRDTPFNEALILLLGENAEDGRARLEELRRTFVNYYINRLADARVYDRVAKLVPELAR